MLTLPILAALFKLVLAVIAVVLVRGTLLWLDRSLGNSFLDTIEEATPEARMFYYSTRFAATCLLFGFVLSG